MSNLGEEIEEASRGRKIPHDLPDKEELIKKKAAATEKRFDKVNAERDTAEGGGDVEPSDVARGSAKETVSDKITPH